MKKLKSIRVTVYNEHLRDLYPHATKWQVIKYKIYLFLQKAGLVFAGLVVLASVGSVSYAFGQVSLAPTTYTPDDGMVPFLHKVEVCESSKHATDPKTGQVLLHVNKDGSVDIGRYGINNKAWGRSATNLGLDLTKDGDNKKMAIYIFRNRGSADWYSSEDCWNKIK